jgi:cytidine deaminase
MRYREAINIAHTPNKLEKLILPLITNIDFRDRILEKNERLKRSGLERLNVDLKKHFSTEEFEQILDAVTFSLDHIEKENLEELGSKPIVTSFARGISQNKTIDLMGRNLLLKTQSTPTGMCAEMGMCAMAKAEIADFKSINSVVITSFSQAENKLFQCCPGCRAYLLDLLSHETKVIFVNHKDGKINLAGFHTLSELDPQNAAQVYKIQNPDVAQSKSWSIFSEALNIVNPSQISQYISNKEPYVLGCVIFEATQEQASGLENVIALENNPGFYVFYTTLEVTKGTKRCVSPGVVGFNSVQRMFGQFAPKIVFTLDEEKNILPPDNVLIAYLQSMREREISKGTEVVTILDDETLILPFSKYYPHQDVESRFILEESTNLNS